MVTIGKNEIPNKSTELSVKQFSKVNEILRSENEPIEKWYQIFTYLGADESDINDLEFDEFKEVVRLFNDSESKDLEIQRTIEIDGYTYEAYKEDFKVSVKDLKAIEKLIAKNPNSYIAEMVAVLYKRTDLTEKEHYEPAHIKHKTTLFADQKASFALPIIWHVAKKMTNEIEKVDDESVA
jgi:hypothetical protein